MFVVVLLFHSPSIFHPFGSQVPTKHTHTNTYTGYQPIGMLNGKHNDWDKQRNGEKNQSERKIYERMNGGHVDKQKAYPPSTKLIHWTMFLT